MPDWRCEVSQRLARWQLSPEREASLVAELAQHLEEHYADLLAEGVPEENAREEVLAGLEDHNLLRDWRNLRREEIAMPAAKPASPWSELGFDIRFALRMLRKSPGFAIVAILTLAVGLGASTAEYSLVDTLLLRPFYPDMQRLVILEDVPTSARGQQLNMTYKMSYPKYLAWKEQKDIFEDVAAIYMQGPSLTGLGEPERLRAALVSSDLLPMLGISPMLGRSFRSDEEPRSASPVVLLSNAFWRSHFDSDPRVIGRKLVLEDQIFSIIGVLPANARLGPGLLKRMDLSPFDVIEPLRPDPDTAVVGSNYFAVFAKLRAGMPAARASGAIESRHRAINQHLGLRNDIQVIPLETYLMGEPRPLVLILLGAVAAVLLLACANIANLLLARGAAREKEIAIRAALGASRHRLVRQLLTESVLISALGAGVGLAGLWALQQSLTGLLIDRLPSGARISVDPSVLTFTLVLSLLTGLAFGTIPAWHAAGRNVRERLDQGGRLSGAGGSQRIRNVLVVSEIALSMVLLAAVGLLLRSFARLLKVDSGFDSDHVLTLRIWAPPSRYADPRVGLAYLTAILQQTRALPGVQSAGWISDLPLSGFTTTGGFAILGKPDEGDTIQGSKQLVAGDYFRAMHIRLLRGRLFNDHDDTNSSPVAIIDQAFARQYFGAANPIGQRVNFFWGGGAWCEIVGVVGEVKETALASAAIPTVYVPLAQRTSLLEGLAFSLAVRTSLDPDETARSVGDVIHHLDSAQIIEGVRTMDQVVDTSLSSRRAPLWLFSGFAGIALFLAAIGVYGVLAHYVTLRLEEIGIRLALGAQRRHILQVVMGHAGKLIAAGLAGGAITTFVVARGLTTQLYDTRPTDGLTLLAVSVVLATVALLACIVPTWRATRVDPQIVLRSE